MIKLSDVPKLRLISQHIGIRSFKTAQEIVERMGGMQAQDFEMAEWALGVRLQDSTEKLIKSAIDNGEIIRIHLMRPTWHFVSSSDIYWMLELTAPQIKSALRYRNKELELNEKILGKCNKIIETALLSGGNLTREELVGVLNKNKIKTENNRASHIFLNAELDGLMCSGRIKNGKQTYALLNKRVPEVKTLKRDDAIGKLAVKYFLSRGPASLEDFVWWSGLPVKDARKGLEMVKHRLAALEINSKKYWLPDSFEEPASHKNHVYILPAFDEFILSYKDRGAIIDMNNRKNAVSNNGVFRPVILVNGKISGVWKRKKKNGEIIIETELFDKGKKLPETSIKKLFGYYGRFIGKNIKVVDKNCA